MKTFLFTVMMIAQACSKPLVDNDTIIFINSEGFESGAINLEYGEYFQGDIVVDEEQKEYLLRNDTDGTFSTRTGILFLSARWPKNSMGLVIVPYTIGMEYSKTKITAKMRKLKLSYFKAWRDQYLTKTALSVIEGMTCVKFVARETEMDYVHVRSGNGCSSHLGKLGGIVRIDIPSEMVA